VHSLMQKFGDFPPSGINVFLGEYSLYGDSEPLPKQTFAVTRIFLHPQYEFTLQVRWCPLPFRILSCFNSSTSKKGDILIHNNFSNNRPTVMTWPC
jgi:hypothetical protein